MLNQGIQALILGKNGAKSDVEGCLLRSSGIMRGQKKKWHARQDPSEHLRCVETIHYRHRKIEDNQVGFKYSRLGNRVGAIFRFASHYESITRLK